MRQIIGSLETGSVEVIDVPRPRPGRGEILVANEFSVISAGTERMLVAFGAASLVEKARREPGRVRQVVDKAMTDGIAPTIRAVKARLGEPIPLGYSSSGVVVEVGEGVTEFAAGDRVATNGAHADMVVVPARLAARIPDGVSMRDAAFTTVAAVGMNALREAELSFGSVVAILGLGLVGQLTARVAHAAGYQVVAFDPNEERAASIESFGSGFSDPHSFLVNVRHRTEEDGADAVIITADVGERGDGPDAIDIGCDAARKRAALVLVGNGDPRIDRRQFYDKELRFKVAHAYGPGRDDRRWELGEVDYERHQERWTARRNFEVVLEFLAEDRVVLRDLDDAEFELDDAARAYETLTSGNASLASVFRYPSQIDGADIVSIPTTGSVKRGAIGVGIVGAGNFVQRVLAPTLAETEVDLRIIASRGGLSSVLAGRKFGFDSSTTRLDRMLATDDVDVVFIATRHDSHAELASRALEAGKHVWLEKPVAIDRAGLELLEDAWRSTQGRQKLMVGYNRRFAPTMQGLRESLRGQGRRSMVYTVNAGKLPPDHWLLDLEVGGGRIVGEATHFVDALRFLADSPIRRVQASLRDRNDGTLVIDFEDGSIGTVHYLTDGHPSVPKERLEVFAGGRVFQLDNFRGLDIYEDRFAPLERLKKLGRSSTQDKGHTAAVHAFLTAIVDGAPSPVPPEESFEVARAIFDALGV